MQWTKIGKVNDGEKGLGRRKLELMIEKKDGFEKAVKRLSRKSSRKSETSHETRRVVKRSSSKM